MAIFYKHIKGCPSGKPIADGPLTYLTWTDATPSVMVGETIYGNITTTEKDYEISEIWTFKKGLQIGQYLTITPENYSASLKFNADQEQITTFSFECTTVNAQRLQLTHECRAESLDARSCTVESLTATGPCTAQYFNATSDMRAKENIKPATYNALELIKKLPVYTYNYKGQEETVTGILAQDLLANQPEELNLVSNENATGIDNDYMSIKNDKLMFVLLKAIQEQEQKIEELENRLKELENR